MKRVASRPRLLAAELARAEGVAAAPSDDGKLAGLLSGLSEAEAATVLEEVWALAGIDPVGGRGPAEIAQRLIRRAQAAQAPALTGDQADRIRRFLAIEDAPQAAFDAMRAVAGRGAGRPAGGLGRAPGAADRGRRAGGEDALRHRPGSRLRLL